VSKMELFKQSGELQHIRQPLSRSSNHTTHVRSGH
jgi:hypothetical protein